MWWHKIFHKIAYAKGSTPSGYKVTHLWGCSCGKTWKTTVEF